MSFPFVSFSQINSAYDSAIFGVLFDIFWPKQEYLFYPRDDVHFFLSLSPASLGVFESDTR